MLRNLVLNQCLLVSVFELNYVSIENQLAEGPQYKELPDKNHIAWQPYFHFYSFLCFYFKISIIIKKYMWFYVNYFIDIWFSDIWSNFYFLMQFGLSCVLNLIPGSHSLVNFELFYFFNLNFRHFAYFGQHFFFGNTKSIFFNMTL